MNKKIILSIFSVTVFISLLLILFTFFPPTFFTKYLVKKNQAYFVYGENFNEVRNLYFDFVMQRYFANNFENNIKNISKISKETKKFLVDQEESYFYNYSLNETFYGVSLGQVILLGYGACEGVNGALGLRLHKDFSKIKLFSLYNKEEKSSPHTLIKYTNKNNDYFIDIWGVERAHFFSFSKNKNLENEIYNKKYYNFEKVLFDNGFVLKTFDLQFYFYRLLNALNNIGIFKNMIPEQKAKPEVKEKVSDRKTDVDTYKDYKPWLDEKLISLSNKYIDARFYHINAQENKAVKLYNEIIQSNCDYEFCKLSKIILSKLNKKN